MVYVYELVCLKHQVHKNGSKFMVYVYELACLKLKFIKMDHGPCFWTCLPKMSSSQKWIKIYGPYLWTCLEENINFISMDHNLWSMFINLSA